MGTWGPGTFDSDAASDFINEEVRRHASAIERIFADSHRFRLDEDAVAFTFVFTSPGPSRLVSYL